MLTASVTEYDILCARCVCVYIVAYMYLYTHVYVSVYMYTYLCIYIDGLLKWIFKTNKVWFDKWIIFDNNTEIIKLNIIILLLLMRKLRLK